VFPLFFQEISTGIAVSSRCRNRWQVVSVDLLKNLCLTLPAEEGMGDAATEFPVETKGYKKYFEITGLTQGL
jgi:hypothetical protein